MKKQVTLFFSLGRPISQIRQSAHELHERLAVDVRHARYERRSLVGREHGELGQRAQLIDLGVAMQRVQPTQKHARHRVAFVERGDVGARRARGGASLCALHGDGRCGAACAARLCAAPILIF